MKKPANKIQNRIETSSITISAFLEETYVLKCIVEEVASTRFDNSYPYEPVQPGWEGIETSSLEADASGYINFSEKNDLINLPFESCFLFTCAKGKGSAYDLTWASSLS